MVTRTARLSHYYEETASVWKGILTNRSWNTISLQEDVLRALATWPSDCMMGHEIFVWGDIVWNHLRPAPFST